MASTDFVLAGANGTAPGRIHRATCKRIPANRDTHWAVTLEKALGLDPAAVADSTLASCCKPKGAQVYIDQAIEAGRRPATPATPAPAEEPEEDLIGDVPAETAPARRTVTAAEAPAPAEDGEPTVKVEGPLRVIDLGETKISKHYWGALRRVAAPLVAGEEALVQRRGAGEIVFLDEGANQAALRALDVFQAAFASLSAWRRRDSHYKALPPQDTKWVTSDRYAWERDFLIGYVRASLGLKAARTYADDSHPSRSGAAEAKKVHA